MFLKMEIPVLSVNAPELKRIVIKRLVLCSLSSYKAVNNTKPLAREYILVRFNHKI